jgi:hypothetical protein
MLVFISRGGAALLISSGSSARGKRPRIATEDDHSDIRCDVIGSIGHRHSC